MYSMTRPLAALAVLLLATASAAHAQAPAGPPIDAQTQLFCRDNSGTPVLQTYSNLGGVMRRWKERFKFDMSVRSGAPLLVVFSNPAETPYSIIYTVEAYRDPAGRNGILLDSMHIFLDNADRDVEGAAMCYFTEYGK
jgi:hypothetical protein